MQSERQMFIYNRGHKYELPEVVLESIRTTDCEASRHILKTLKENATATEIHFHRHASCTSNIFDFFDGDKLHIPTDVCPNKFREELLYWGLTENNIEPCCYTKYVSFFGDMKVLKVLETEENLRKITRDRIDTLSKISLRAKIWTIMEYPSSSILAKIYLYGSNAFVLLSLFVLVASTHPVFKRSLTNDEWVDYFTDEEEEKYFYGLVGYDYVPQHFGNLSENGTFEEVLFPSDIYVTASFMFYLTTIAVVYFTIEIVCRLLCFPLPWKQFITFLNMVDIFALLVMYMSLIANEIDTKEKYKDNSSHDVVHSLQIIRVFRLFRLVKNISGFRIIVYTVKQSLLDLFLMLLCLFTAVLLFSSMAYFSRDPAFKSIPDASWWALITLTTVGYGDISPTTLLGKIIGSACAVSGVCLLAILIPILVNNFLLFYSHSIALERREKIGKNKSFTKYSSIVPDKEGV